MKIKNDFVTNSSSSAFIVIWPCIIETEDDVSRYIKDQLYVPIIFKDAIDQYIQLTPLTNKAPGAINRISSELRCGYFSGIIDYWDHKKTVCEREGITQEELYRNNFWIKQIDLETEIIQKQQATKIAKEFLEANDGYIYFFNYGDEDGSLFAKLEHENDWGGLPYLQISHH